MELQFGDAFDMLSENTIKAFREYEAKEEAKRELIKFYLILLNETVSSKWSNWRTSSDEEKEIWSDLYDRRIATAYYLVNNFDFMACEYEKYGITESEANWIIMDTDDESLELSKPYLDKLKKEAKEPIVYQTEENVYHVKGNVWDISHEQINNYNVGDILLETKSGDTFVVVVNEDGKFFVKIC